MTASISGFGTAVPPTRLAQEDVRAIMAAQPELDRRARRWIDAAFAASAIQTRHTVLAELGGEASGLHIHDNGRLLFPSTKERNDEFRRAAPPLFAAAARAALDAADTDPSEITHVITVSCTGLFSPGPDALLVHDLGLNPAVERDHLGFIGCAAAVPALRLASRIVASDPDAVVLVSAVELCSLHIRSSNDPEQVVSASLFADGAAAAVISGDPSRGRGRRFDLAGFATRLSADGEKDMTWVVGDNGFEMTLTAQVPRIIGREIRAIVDDVFGGPDALDAWAVHPGGRSILDRVESGLGLDPDALAASRQVLRDYGNMSSTTLLFILKAMLEDDTRPDGQRIGALAFGPGLTVESARLVVRDAAAAEHPVADRQPALAQR
jgi:predicted naringenin-chalcone synthase